MLLDRAQRHGGEGEEGTEVDEVGHRIFQLDDQGARVRGTQADLIETGAAFGEGARAADDMQQAGVIGAGLGRQHAPPGVDEIPGDHGRAVAPGRAGAQVEGVGLAILGDVPALGHAGLGAAVFIDAAEAFEERGRDAHRHLIGGERGVQRLRLGTLQEHQVGARLPLPAGDEQQRAEEEGEAGHGEGRVLSAWC